MGNHILLKVGANPDRPFDEELHPEPLPNDPVRFEDYYPLIGCDLIEPIDLTFPRADGSEFTICLMMDEEGLLKGSPVNKTASILSIFLGGPGRIVGNVVIVGDTDDDGEMHGLTDEDVDDVVALVSDAVSMMGIEVEEVTG